MAPYLRFRQVALVAPTLEPVASDISFILGLDVCFRDPAVGKYGLENALWSIGDMFLEVVAPIEPNTAGGRFLERSKGHGGYMAIFDCDDPGARGVHCESIGVKKIVEHTHGAYTGVQLHPRYCRAAMLEFNHTEGGEADPNLYAPAGPDWLNHVKSDQTRRILAVEVEARTPLELASHWGKITQTRVEADADASPMLRFPEADIRFIQSAPDAFECIGALVVECADPDATLQRANALGYAPFGGAFHIAGVHVRPVSLA